MQLECASKPLLGPGEDSIKFALIAHQNNAHSCEHKRSGLNAHSMCIKVPHVKAPYKHHNVNANSQQCSQNLPFLWSSCNQVYFTSPVYISRISNPFTIQFTNNTYSHRDLAGPMMTLQQMHTNIFSSFGIWFSKVAIEQKICEQPR